MKVYCDNKLAISIAHNPVLYDRTKHIDFTEMELECANLRRKIKVAKELGGNYKWKMLFCMVMLAINWFVFVLTAMAISSK